MQVRSAQLSLEMMKKSGIQKPEEKRIRKWFPPIILAPDLWILDSTFRHSFSTIDTTHRLFRVSHASGNALWRYLFNSLEVFFR
jgi:hypothetical protein